MIASVIEIGDNLRTLLMVIATPAGAALAAWASNRKTRQELTGTTKDEDGKAPTLRDAIEEIRESQQIGDTRNRVAQAHLLEKLDELEARQQIQHRDVGLRLDELERRHAERTKELEAHVDQAVAVAITGENPVIADAPNE
jgi:hypothetical protein